MATSRPGSAKRRGQANILAFAGCMMLALPLMFGIMDLAVLFEDVFLGRLAAFNEVVAASHLGRDMDLGLKNESDALAAGQAEVTDFIASMPMLGSKPAVTDVSLTLETCAVPCTQAYGGTADSGDLQFAHGSVTLVVQPMFRLPGFGPWTITFTDVKRMERFYRA